MEETRLCSACRADLVGPFQPKITLTRRGADEEDFRVAAWAWVCPGCGLVHWYTGDEALDGLMALAQREAEADAPEPASDYERRVQMLRMLRRVKRM